MTFSFFQKGYEGKEYKEIQKNKNQRGVRKSHFLRIWGKQIRTTKKDGDVEYQFSLYHVITMSLRREHWLLATVRFISRADNESISYNK